MAEYIENFLLTLLENKIETNFLIVKCLFKVRNESK